MQQETRILLVVALMAALLTFTGGHNRTAVTSTPSSLNKNVTVTVTPSPTVAPSDSAIDDPVLDDDLATRKDDDTTIKAEEKTDEPSNRAKPRKKHTFFKFFVLCFFCYGIWRVFFSSDQFRFRSQYTNLDAANIARETYLSV